ncbi:MAG: alpha/beta hydrolase [Caulobacterales bacterium]|jgi:pimeloyl-ACP methyl ester carboxylesterase
MIEFTDQRSEDGVTRRSFEITVAGERVPAVLWAPEDASGPRPLILMGHGGSQHKKTPGIRTRAAQYAQRFGYATLAIDAPGHGDRISREQAETLMRETGARVTGQVASAWTPERLKIMADRTRQAVPEWKAALDAVQALDFIGSGGPVGYWGVSMGTAIGVPFLAEEPRVTCAVLGLAGLRPGADDFATAAARIAIPVEFVFQWDDAVASREHGVALFDAFGSAEKTLHVNPGGHLEIPAFEGASWERFFQRHLSGTAKAGVLQAA